MHRSQLVLGAEPALVARHAHVSVRIILILDAQLLELAEQEVLVSHPRILPDARGSNDLIHMLLSVTVLELNVFDAPLTFGDFAVLLSVLAQLFVDFCGDFIDMLGGHLSVALAVDSSHEFNIIVLDIVDAAGFFDFRLEVGPPLLLDFLFHRQAHLLDPSLGLVDGDDVFLLSKNVV